MKKTIVIPVLVFVVMLVTGFLFFLNELVISIRLNELKSTLQQQNRSENSMDHIELVATYLINKDIYDKKISQEKADSLESKVMSLSRGEDSGSSRAYPYKYRFFSYPAISLINFNRKIIGKVPLRFLSSQESDYIRDLDLAYYYERNFQFPSSIKLYDKVLKADIDNSLRASIMLHQGYCYALSGSNEMALDNYSRIINDYGNENSAVTAAILSTYQKGFILARKKVLSSTDDPVKRSESLVSLLAYEQALDILEQAEQEAGEKDLLRIRYFKARCFAGMGDTEEAVNSYLNVIETDPTSEYAKYSNRKLFIVGTRVSGENRITKISEEINSKLKDPILSEMVEDYKEDRKSFVKAVDSEVIPAIEKITIPEQVVEKIEEAALEKKKEKEKKQSCLIVTNDGNSFKGIVIGEKETELLLQTSIGIIHVKKDKIKSITENQ